MHPLLPDLSEVSMDELQAKYNDLVKRMVQVQRFGPPSAMNQLNMFLEGYRYEISNRQRKMLDDASKNKEFKNIIDIQ
jgi:hypothetical protein